MCFFSTRFCLVNAAVVYVYFTNFQQIDDEEYGGPLELTKEGFMSSFALFMVSHLKQGVHLQSNYNCSHFS